MASRKREATGRRYGGIKYQNALTLHLTQAKSADANDGVVRHQAQRAAGYLVMRMLC
jgi:hypothetical protein